jgi:hypothetical protein
MTFRALILACAACALAAPVFADNGSTPYAGQETRTLKALSDQDIAALQNGEGMGMAKAAELNGYPGPKHVLEVASELGLTPEQVRAITAIRDRMSAGAKPLGAEILRRERDLDGSFASGTVVDDGLALQTEAIGALEGRLRAVHLAAHLATKALLTPAQIERYEHLRGYKAGPAGGEHKHHHGE